MNEIINSDPHLHNLSQLITSVPHVGKIIATEILVATNEFKDISCPRKFCSYCGIAPFARTSGTSLKKRPRVSHIANKDLENHTSPGSPRFHQTWAVNVQSLLCPKGGRGKK